MSQGFVNTNNIILPLVVSQGGTGVTTSLGSGSVLLGTLPAITQITVQNFTSTGAFTYTPTTGMKYIRVRMVGAGGGSGGAGASSGQSAASAPGNSGGYLEFFMTAAQIGASKTGSVGAGGLAGTAGNNAGGTGGNTTFADWTAVGGNGGGGGGSSASAQFLAPSASANNTVGTGSIVSNFSTGVGSYSFTTGTVFLFGGYGGSNPLGQGGAITARTTTGSVSGFASSGKGGGAGGSIAYSATNQAGVVGGDGVVYIEEYLSV